jgi:DnaJ-class molecular chaperone
MTRDIDNQMICPACHGTGTNLQPASAPPSGYPERCPQCHGAGSIADPSHSAAHHHELPSLATLLSGVSIDFGGAESRHT